MHSSGDQAGHLASRLPFSKEVRTLFRTRLNIAPCTLGDVNESSPLTLAQLISSLPEEERVILMLHYLRNLSTEQIAQAIGAPERAVLGVLAAGRARLQASFNFPSPD